MGSIRSPVLCLEPYNLSFNYVKTGGAAEFFAFGKKDLQTKAYAEERFSGFNSS